VLPPAPIAWPYSFFMSHKHDNMTRGACMFVLCEECDKMLGFSFCLSNDGAVNGDSKLIELTELTCYFYTTTCSIHNHCQFWKPHQQPRPKLHEGQHFLFNPWHACARSLMKEHVKPSCCRNSKLSAWTSLKAEAKSALAHYNWDLSCDNV